MTVRVRDIIWDTDGEDPAELGLPVRASVEVGDLDEVADALSDKYGWLVMSYRLSNPAQPEKRKKGKNHGKKRIRSDAAARVR